MTWSKDGSPYLPEGITALSDGTLRATGRSNQIDGRYTIDVANAYGRTSASVYIRWREPSKFADDSLSASLTEHLLSPRSAIRQLRYVIDLHCTARRIFLTSGAFFRR